MRMDVDRHVEFDRRGQQAVIARVIEEAALGRAVDQGAEEFELLDGAHQLGGAGVRACHRQHGEAGKPVGMPRDRAAKWSLISRAMATPSAPGTRSGPGPVFESTCMVMPASSIDLRRRSPISGSSSIGFGRPAGGFLGRKPRRLMTAGSMRPDQSRHGEMFFDGDDTHRRISSGLFARAQLGSRPRCGLSDCRLVIYPVRTAYAACAPPDQSARRGSAPKT